MITYPPQENKWLDVYHAETRNRTRGACDNYCHGDLNNNENTPTLLVYVCGATDVYLTELIVVPFAMTASTTVGEISIQNTVDSCEPSASTPVSTFVTQSAETVRTDRPE